LTNYAANARSYAGHDLHNTVCDTDWSYGWPCPRLCNNIFIFRMTPARKDCMTTILMWSWPSWWDPLMR